MSGLPAGTWTINPGNISGDTASTTISGLTAGTYNFTVTNSVGCTSNASADVVIAPQPETPAAPIVGANQSACFSVPMQPLTATATVPAGQTITWFDAPFGGNVIANPSLSTVGTVTYYPEASNGVCSSLTRGSITLTIYAAPQSPVLNDEIGQCSATVTPPSIQDNCGNTLIGTTNDPTSYTAQGTYVVTWNFNDALGNFVVSATQNVKVQDTQAPTFVTLLPVTGECSAQVTPPVGFDNCVGQVTATTTDPLTYNTQGTFVINWVFSDGINSVTATQTVIVDDVTAPVVPVLADVIGQCSVTVPAPSATDVCNLNVIVGTTTDPLTYTTVGSYVITWTFDDGNGNIITATQNAIVNPANAPTQITGYAICNNDNSPEREIDLDSLLPAGTPSGGEWTDVSNSGNLIGTVFSPYLLDIGIYQFKYEVPDNDCTLVVELSMEVDDDCITGGECSPLLVHNAFSPNGDDTNELFIIEQIDQINCYPTNTVEIYNRWGVLVYDTKQYDNKNRVFKGISEGRATVNKSSQLPTGTYFYIINYTDKEGNNNSKEGYLFLNQ